jgi:RecJ-like exonuclease
MTYQLKGGEEIRDGKLYGWTGRECETCAGTGEGKQYPTCTGCGGTGEEWGLMPTQPEHLP